jgi:thiamine biosynthesis lipoprotein
LYGTGAAISRARAARSIVAAGGGPECSARNDTGELLAPAKVAPNVMPDQRIVSMLARPSGRIARALAVVLALASPACRAGPDAHEARLEGEALGTVWSVTVVSRAALEAESVAELSRRVAATLERIDRGMSTWRDDAELMQFNRRSGVAPFRFSPETRRVVAAALELARDTGGAFDPTVAPLMPLWGFRGDPERPEPSEEELARVRARVGWWHLAWDDRGRLVTGVPGVELDLSAIAKGYAVDAVVGELVRDRPLGLLVEVGGEVRALGAKATGEPWRVGVENAGAPGSGLEAVIELTGGALATSGDYRQARIVDGERRSHVLDPRRTALMVLGPDEALAWVEQRPWLAALLLIREGDVIVERRASSSWKVWLASE